MIFLPKFDPEAIIKLMARATVLMGVPTFYTRLLQSPALTKESTKHMRLFISGSAPLLADTHREWFARTGHAVLERYGMTETNMNTSNPYDGERVPGAVGHPAARRLGARHRSRDRQGAGARRDRHDRGQGPQRLQGLLADAGKDQSRIPRRRLLHHRRSRQDRRQGLCAHSRPRQGSRDLRRLQRLSEGNRERDRRHAGRDRDPP